MQRCWFANDECRPSFADVKDKMTDLLALESDSLYMRNVTQELSTNYYLNDSHTQHCRQYVSRNTYVTLEGPHLSEESKLNGSTDNKQYSVDVDTKGYTADTKPNAADTKPDAADTKPDAEDTKPDAEDISDKRISSTAF